MEGTGQPNLRKHRTKAQIQIRRKSSACSEESESPINNFKDHITHLKISLNKERGWLERRQIQKC
jgi:hypothetical protein